MSSPLKMQQPEIADKIMRRAEAAKKARLLVDRLGLASFKTKHGWEHLSLDLIEPKVEQHLSRARNSRPSSSGDVFSDTSSSFSDHPFPTTMVCSSPLGALIFSDTIGSMSDTRNTRKRGLSGLSAFDRSTRPGKRPRSMSTAVTNSGNFRSRERQTTKSSPVFRRRHSNFAFSRGHATSFLAEGQPTPIEEADDSASTSDGSVASINDLPAHSFQEPLVTIPSSPPRTPPPSRRGPKSQARPASLQDSRGSLKPGEEGADLLLYLATSPSQATPSRRNLLQTPLAAGRSLDFGEHPKTPGSAFNYYDFVNVTPSPSQHAEFWRTPAPGSARTPARRRLNFDGLAPPSASPGLGSLAGPSSGKQTGLGMELGGELL